MYVWITSLSPSLPPSLPPLSFFPTSPSLPSLPLSLSIFLSQEEIENFSTATDSPEHQEGDAPPSVSLADSRDVLAAHGVITVNQKSLRTNLEEMRLKQTRLLLSYQGEGLERKLTEDMDSAQEAIERAREATEEIEARRQKQREEEGREREKREAEQHKR